MKLSMHCPACDKAVGIAAENAGKQVRCPHCQKPFFVPGAVADHNDDDDWLSLDDQVPAGAKSPESAVRGESATSERDNLFTGDDLPPPAAAATPAAASATSHVAPAGSNPTQTGTPPVAQSTEYQHNYRVRCKVCESPTDVTADQAGQEIQCYDCHSTIKVPPPPKVVKKAEFNLETAQTFAFSDNKPDSRPADPFLKSAQELLDSAEKEEQEDPPESYETPDIMAWFGDVFGIFKQPGVIMYAAIFATLGGLVSYFAIIFPNPYLLMGLLVGGILWTGMTVACGFKIMEAIANGESEVEDWPEFLDPGEWMGPILTCLAAIALVSSPAWFLGATVFGGGLMTVLLTMFMIYLLFPFVLLSMLDMQNIFAPFSPEVARSVTISKDSWAGFYFSAALVFVAMFMTYATASLASGAATAVFSAAVTVIGTFTYFAMLGRLAYSIGQSVNDSSPENDVESSSAKQARQSAP